VYWAVTAVPRKSVDTTCLQKPKPRLARILAAARPRRLHVVPLAPCRHIALSVENRAAAGGGEGGTDFHVDVWQPHPLGCFS